MVPKNSKPFKSFRGAKSVSLFFQSPFFCFHFFFQNIVFAASFFKVSTLFQIQIVFFWLISTSKIMSSKMFEGLAHHQLKRPFENLSIFDGPEPKIPKVFYFFGGCFHVCLQFHLYKLIVAVHNWFYDPSLGFKVTHIELFEPSLLKIFLLFHFARSFNFFLILQSCDVIITFWKGQMRAKEGCEMQVYWRAHKIQTELFGTCYPCLIRSIQKSDPVHLAFSTILVTENNLFFEWQIDTVFLNPYFLWFTGNWDSRSCFFLRVCRKLQNFLLADIFSFLKPATKTYTLGRGHPFDAK